LYVDSRAVLESSISDLGEVLNELILDPVGVIHAVFAVGESGGVTQWSDEDGDAGGIGRNLYARGRQETRAVEFRDHEYAH